MKALPPTAARTDRLKQLRVFCHAARLGSISRAAEYTFISQPAASQQIRLLEEDFSATLFDRGGPRIALTEAGKLLYRIALPAVMDVDRLPGIFAERHHGVVSGGLTIAAGRGSANFLLPKYLKALREQHPEVRVKVRTGSGTDRLGWLRAYEVDIAFGAMDVTPPDLAFHPLRSSRAVLITPEDHPLAGRDSVTLGEIATYPVVAHPADRFIRRYTAMLARLQGISGEAAVEVAGWSAIKRHVEAGAGVSVVPDLCLTGRERLWRCPVDRGFPERQYGLIVRNRGPLSLLAERFIGLVRSPDSPEAVGGEAEP